MSLAPAHTLLRTHMRMRALHSVGQQTQAQQRRSLRSSSRTYASSSSGSGSGSGSAPSDADLSRAAFAQRQLLSSLRASSSSSASALGAASPPADPHANARAALSGAGARGGMSMGLGLGTGMGSGDGTGGTLDRAAGGGKKWKELRGGQKVVRAGLTTSRLLLVLVGGGLTIAVGWAVGSELFASNSPTVIYNDAVKRVRRSGQIQEHLLLPYRFSSSSTYSSDSSPLNPSGSRGRKRGSQVSSQLVREGSSDVLLLRFFMQAREKDKEWTWLQSARHAVVEAGARVKMEAVALANQIGDAISPQDATSAAAQAVQEEKKAAGGGWWSNPFKSLRQGVEAPLRAKPTPGTWSSGEVHAELTRDEDGIFQYRRLYVDIPSSQAATRSRVWLVRREGEVVR